MTQTILTDPRMTQALQTDPTMTQTILTDPKMTHDSYRHDTKQGITYSPKNDPDNTY